MRLDGWELRLAEVVEAARLRAFEYGTHDCVCWAFGVRAALTGQDDWASFRGKYTTEAGAARVLRRLGCETVDDLARSILGEPLPTVLLAQRGDIVLGGAEQALGVCIGADALFLQPKGLVPLPLRACLRAWRV